MADNDMQDDDLDERKGEMVELDDEDVEVEDTDDGGAIIRLKNEEDAQQKRAHFDNIIEEVDRSTLSSIVVDLIDKITRDKDAREKRDTLYEEGLRRTGLGDDAPGGAQFVGANKVVHPMLVEACVDFSARVMKEIWPAGGPVKSKVLGEVEPDKLEKARRKTEFMNWQTTTQMKELKGELEQLSTQLPLGGGQYLKVMYSRKWRRASSEFIPIDDMLIPFAATNFYTADRKTHVQYVTRAEFNRRVQSGMYIDVELGTPDQVEFSKASEANDKIEGRQDNNYNEDGLRTLFETYVYLDIGDGDAPYIITIDKSTRQALSLYRNWELDDEDREELDWIVEFPFVPWRGAYPIGLTHMIGSLSGGATGALRALLDSAHIQNIPTVLKLKGGPGGQTLNVKPTEVLELEGGAMVDDVRKLAMPLPFGGPSPTLFQLLGFLVDAGKGVVQTSFEKLSDQNPNMPVGTTLALIEQGMVVFSSIHARLHSAMERVLNIIHRINSAYLTEDDIKRLKLGLDVRPEDFDGEMDVMPVSDPQIFSEVQRMAQTQAVQARAQVLPQLYDLRKVEEMFLRNMKLSPDDVLQPAPGEDDRDPVSENVAAAMGQAIYVLPNQDHIAHIQAHMAFLASPVFGMNPAIVKTYMYPMSIHLRDHLLNFYLSQAHDAVRQAQHGELIEKEGEQQAQLILHVQQLIEQQLQGFAKQLAQIDQMAQQYKPQPQMPPDNSMQVAQLNAQTQQAAIQQRAQSDQARLQQQAQSDQARLQVQQQKDAQQAQLAAQKAELQAKNDAAKLADSQAAREAEMQREQLRQQQENARTQQSNDVKYQMNSDDNATAMRLAAAEIAAGDKVAVSTGTGVNPNPNP